MAQSATTVTPANPTPPTNLSCVGSRPPTDPAQAYADDGYTSPGSVPNVFAAKTAAAGSGTSLDAEGKGSEVTVSATSSNPAPNGQLQTNSCLGNYTTTPNAQHASSLSPAVNPAFSSFTAGSSVSGVGTTTLSCVTVGATPQSVVYVNGVAQNTVFVSATSLTCAAVTKKTSAGPWDIKIVTGGVVETAPRVWTFT